MKLVRFSTNGQQPRLGIIQGDRIADLQTSLAATLTRRGVMRAGEIAAALVPPSTRAFLEGGPAAEEAVAGTSAAAISAARVTPRRVNVAATLA